MMKSDCPALPGAADSLRRRIETWRRTRKRGSPMPEALWTAAAELAKAHGVLRIARAVRVDFGALKKRVHGLATAEKKTACPPGFVEIPAFATPAVSEAVLELADDTGAKMTCRLADGAALDVIALVKAFWRRNA
jgi:hypothetical protein